MGYIDPYTPIHKGLRRALFEMAIAAGAVDPFDAESRAGFQARLESVVEMLRHHARIEETCVHPVLAVRLPGPFRRLERQHDDTDALLDSVAVLEEAQRVLDPRDWLKLKQSLNAEPKAA
jgi:hypothetical protein